LYAPIAGTLVIDSADAHLAAEVEHAGMRCVVTDTIMKTAEIAADLTRTCLNAVGVSG
jgi:LPPG:FO 2-phospho-L-lactate transferase